jgi:uncharacterized membrane-anchored protein YhcB (DUF1043 family)
MTIEIWLGIALFVSLVLNALLVWLTINQSKKLLTVSENMSDLLDIIDNYRDHLKKIYNLDAFYGDETLEFLMNHTRSLIELLGDQYGDVISITEQIEYEIEEEPESEEEESKEKDVLYAGSRRRDS